MFVVGQRPPYVNLDAIPREITVKAGRRVDLEIPYTGKFACYLAVTRRVKARLGFETVNMLWRYIFSDFFEFFVASKCS